MTKALVLILTLILLSGCLKARLYIPVKNCPKKILVIAPCLNLEDKEYENTIFIYKKANATLELASENVGACYTENHEINITRSLKNKTLDFDTLIILGGQSLRANKDLEELVKLANNQGKVVAAGGLAVLTLSDSGVLAGRHATTYPETHLGKNLSKEIEERGALYENRNIVKDGNIITSKSSEFSMLLAVETINVMC